MELANATLHIGNESTVPLKSITPAEAVILVKMHSDRAKKIALTDIKVIGTAQSIEEPGVEPQLDKTTGKVLVDGKAPTFKPRTGLEELARLKTKYHKTRIEDCFPKGTTKVPDSFTEAATTWAPIPVVEEGKVGNWTDVPGPLPKQSGPAPIVKAEAKA